MAILLGLMAAVGFGIADFLVRFATRSIGAYRAQFYLQFFGLVGLSAGVAFSADLQHTIMHATLSAWLWMLTAMLLQIVSVLALYRAFEQGVLSIVSPIAASFAAVTALLSLLSGETVGLQRGLGMLLAIAGVILASYSAAEQLEGHGPGPRQLPPGVGWALASALGFGITFWLLGFQVTPRVGSVVPIWFLRLITPCLLLALAAPLRQSIALPRDSVWWFIGGAGILDTAAFLSATAALSHGRVAIAGVLMSLFSAVTVLLAWIFLRETLSRVQWLGVATIFLGVALVSA